MSSDTAPPPTEETLAARLEASRQETDAQRASTNRVFVSYSRRDLDVAQRLVAALRRHHIDVWIDQEDIPKTAIWREEIAAGIEACDNFVFLISPASIASQPCRDELEHAVGLNKRIIPVICKDVRPADTPPEIERRNWIFLRPVDDFEEGIDELVQALTLDLDWVRMHTALLERAIEWDRGGRDSSRLLRGSQLREAESWQAQAGSGKEPQPTALQLQYILASRRAQTRFQGRLIGALVLVLIVVSVAAVVALIERSAAIQERNTAQSKQLASSAVSVLGTDPELGVMLAAEGMRHADTQQAEDALRQSLYESHVRISLRGHRGPVERVAFSPNGRYLLSISDDHTARVWDWRKHRTLVVLRSGKDAFGSGSFSSDGRTVLTCGLDGTVRIWNWRRGTSPVVLNEGNPATACIFAPGDKEIAVGRKDGLVDIWDLTRRHVVATLRGHHGQATSLSFDHTGTYLASTGYDDQYIAWNWRQGRIIDRNSGPSSAATFGPHTTIVAVDNGLGISLWDARDHSFHKNLQGHLGPVTSLQFSPNGESLLSSSHDGTARVWAWYYQYTVEKLAATMGAVESAAFSPDARWIATGSDDGVVRVWQAPTVLEPVQTVWGTSVAFSNDGRYVFTGYGHAPIEVWTVAGGRPVRTLPGSSVGADSLAVSRDGTYLLAGSNDGTARIWNWRTGRLVRILRSGGKVRGAVFSRDGHSVVTVSSTSVVIWDWQKGTVGGRAPTNMDLSSVAFAPDGRHWATGGGQGQIEISSWLGMRIMHLRLPDVDNSLVYDVRFSPNGRYLVAAYQDDRARVWDWRRKRVVATLAGSVGAIYRASFSPDGRYVLTSSLDRTARLWDWRRQQDILTFDGNDAWVVDAEFSPNGKTVALTDGSVDRVIACDMCGPASSLLPLADRRITRGFSATERRTYLP